MTILLKTEIKWPINVKLRAINHICQHQHEKKLLDNIFLDSYEHHATKIMVKNTFLMFDYSWLPLFWTAMESLLRRRPASLINATMGSEEGVRGTNNGGGGKGSLPTLSETSSKGFSATDFSMEEKL